MTDQTSMSKLALVVDDEPDIRSLISITLGRMQIKCMEAGTLTKARQLLDTQRFDVCLTDMRLPDGNGIDFVREIQYDRPDLPVAMITAYGNVETAVEALKAGAFDFIAKPVKLDELRRIVDAALQVGERVAESVPWEIEADLIGDSPPMQQLREMIRRVARSQSPVLIRGSTGTGKELVARLIHRSSGRKSGPWIPVNCGAIPTELMESEFFGHKKGSFTGAHQDTQGLFEAASGGTLFLDEIAELPLSMQVKLLRAIQERKVKAVGGATERSVDVRILSATNQDLGNLVKAGAFRDDLYYRLNVIELCAPDLRERREDIPKLAKLFLNRLNRDSDEAPKWFSEAALDRLSEHHYPGNIRELENIVERSFTLSSETEVDVGDIQFVNHSPIGNPSGDDEYMPGDVPLDDHLAEIEKRALVQAVERASGNKTMAAELLGMSFRSFRYKLKKYGL